MSYLVLARKYRPTTFAEVVGQDHVTRTLGNAFAAGRVHHAFLFCGPRGCGKTTLARIVGKALNCEARPPGAAATAATAEPCGVCGACTSISNGSAVDYQEMDGASNRGIDAIRELTEAVRYQPAVLRKKVYVIDEVHMLTTEAFNALLKTLEEPPPHVTFVLATTEPHKLPNTILSRCQRYDFKLVPASRLAQHLASIFAKEQLAIEPGAISLVVRESGGSVRDALSLCDQLISYVGDATMTERHVAEVLGVADRSLTRTLIRALAGGDAGAALAAVESAIERGVDEVQLARAIVRYLRDLSVTQVAPGRRGLVDATEEELAELHAEAAALDRSRVTQMFERMLRCCDELGKTLQPRLVLDCALIDVATIEPLVPLGDLLERLTELEGRLAGKPARPGGSGGGSPRDKPRASSSAPPASSGSSGSGPRPTTPIRTAPPAGITYQVPVVAGLRAADSAAAPSAEISYPVPVVTRPASVAASISGSTSARSISAPPEAEAEATSPRPPDAAPASPGRAAREEASVASTSPGTSSARAPLAGQPAERADRAPEGTAVLAIQPSGPVPRPDAVAAGSGPHGVDRAPDPGPDHEDHEEREERAPARGIAPAPSAGSPAPPAAPLAVPATPTEALRTWGAVLAELTALRRLSLFGPFELARVMSWTADQLELGFPVDVRDMGEMAKDNADELRAIIRGMSPAFKNLRVSVRLLDAGESSATGARSVLETTREHKSVERSKREAEARAHPITKHVLQTFGAQIKEIKTDV